MILLILVVVIAMLIISKREDKVMNVSKMLVLIGIGGIILAVVLLVIAKAGDAFTWY